MKKIIGIALFLTSSILLASEEVENKFKQERLVIVVSSNDDPVDPKLNLKGYFVYHSMGEKIRREIDLRKGAALSFHGDSFDEVEIQNTGKGGSYQIWVVEGEEEVLSSGLVEHNDPIIYVKGQ